MIIYATKLTIERYKISLYNELKDPFMNSLTNIVYRNENGDDLLEWGAKIFYFQGKKCIELINFASRFTIFLIDFKIDDLEFTGEFIAQYMLDIYSDNKEMTNLLLRFFKDHPLVCFAKISDKSVISTLNSTYSYFLDEGYLLYDYIWDKTLHTKELNKFVNKKYPFKVKKDGKTEYLFPAEYFEELLKKRYEKENKAHKDLK